ncbi:MAG: hypothetical protein NZ480_08125, partial [Bdellovibrionaceae bacterium]|nr:hypothetical protein [Pseudobdellovibrionaceae bacterium]
MIIPWIDGIKTIGLAPLTWLLILINLLFFLVTYQPAEEHKKINEQDLRWLYVMQHGSDDVPNDKDLLTAWQTLMSTNLVYEITDLKKQTHYPNPIEHEYRHQKILSIVAKI